MALYQESQRNGTELTQEYYDAQDAVSALAKEYQSAVRPISAYQKAVDEGAAAAAEAQAEIDEFTAAVDSLTGAAAEQAGTLPELENALAPVRNEIDRLAAAYNEAYDAALSSMEGQYALWDKAETIVPTSAASVNAALESQARYWQEYNQNIQTVLDNAGDIAGLNELLAGLNAGDKDTVNFVAGLAQASRTDKKALEEMVQNWQEAKRRQEEAAGSFSEYASGLAGEMDGLREELVQSVRDMDLSGEAAESATEERRMLNRMAEDYDVNPAYVLDMYQHGKVNWMLDVLLRLAVCVAAAVIVWGIKKAVSKCKLPTRDE